MSSRKRSQFRQARLRKCRPPRRRMPRLPRKRLPPNLPLSQPELAKLKRRDDSPVLTIPAGRTPAPPLASCANGWL